MSVRVTLVGSGEGPATTVGASTFFALPLAQLRESPHNPRRRFDQAGLEDLTSSIRAKGILVPLLVRPIDGHYEIIAGARRFRAARAAGLTDVPVLVRELTDAQALEAQVIENLQRADVHPLDEAAGYRALMDQVQYDAAALAAKVGKSVSYIYQRLQLTKLVDGFQQLFLEGELTAGHAVELARLTPVDQGRLLKDEHHQLFEYAWNNGRQQRIGVVGIRTLRHVIRSTCHLDLARAPWDLADAELVKNAGPCLSCPKRAGANPALFADIAEADTCTDPACYALKQQRTAERKQTELAANGETVVLISTEGSYSGHDDTRLKAAGILPRRDYAGKDQAGWKEAGRQRCPHMAKGVVADGHDIGTVKVVCTAPGSCHVHRVVYDERRAVSSSRAEMTQRLREQRIQGLARRRTLDAILTRVSWPLGAEDLRAIVLHAFHRLYNPLDRDLVKAMGWWPEPRKKGTAPDHDQLFREHLKTLSIGDLARMAVRVALWTDAAPGPNYFGGRAGPSLAAFATRYKVDAARLAREVRAEQKAVEKKKKTTKPRQATRPAVQTSAQRPRAGTCRVCGCTEAAACAGGCGWADTTKTLCTSCVGREKPLSKHATSRNAKGGRSKRATKPGGVRNRARGNTARVPRASKKAARP